MQSKEGVLGPQTPDYRLSLVEVFAREIRHRRHRGRPCDLNSFQNRDMNKWGINDMNCKNKIEYNEGERDIKHSNMKVFAII